MRIQSFMSFLLTIAIAIAFTACSSPENTDKTVSNSDTLTNTVAESSGFKIAFIYGDTINKNYKFLIDVEAELEQERKLIDERIRRKLQRAEQRAGELQKEAQYMTQTQMQEAQIEMQSLELELQQFEQTLANNFRDREIELQREYIDKVDAYLAVYNADGKYDIILNFQLGGNLLWVKDKFDVTADVLKGLNETYEAEMAAETVETTAP